MKEILRLRKGITSTPTLTSIPFFNRNNTFSLKRIGEGCIPRICACTSEIIQSSIRADAPVFPMFAHSFSFIFQFTCAIFCPICLWFSTLPARKRGWVMIKQCSWELIVWSFHPALSFYFSGPSEIMCILYEVLMNVLVHHKDVRLLKVL